MIRTGNRSLSDFKNFSWNAVGSAVNSITSLFLLMIVTQILGTRDAGLFAIAFTSAQILLSLGLYGIRNYQVTDIFRMYSSGVYLSVRIATSIIMLVVGFLFSMLSHYDLQKTALVCVLVICKISESLSDIFYGIMQKKGKLYIAGISMTLRAVLSITAFFFSLLMVRNLLFSCMLMMVAGYIPLILIDLPVSKREDTIVPLFDKRKMFDLLRTCFPLFSVAMLTIVIMNLPKYVIDRTMSEDFQAIYNIIVTPGTTIALFSQIIVQALLVKLANFHSKSQMRKFLSMIYRIILLIILFTGCCLLLFAFWGDDILLLLYGINLAAYIPQLLIVFVGAMFCSIAGILSVALTTLRITRVQLYLFLINLIFAFGISIYLIPRFGLMGATGSYFLIMLFQMMLYAFVFVRTIYTTKKWAEELN